MYYVFAVRLKRMRIVDAQTVKDLDIRYRVCGYGCPLLLVVPVAIVDIVQLKTIYGSVVCYLKDYFFSVFDAYCM